MLKTKCKIGAESEILLNEEVSFNSEELYINEELFRKKKKKEFEDINII